MLFVGLVDLVCDNMNAVLVTLCSAAVSYLNDSPQHSTA
jgi:hypothetical protein